MSDTLRNKTNYHIIRISPVQRRDPSHVIFETITAQWVASQNIDHYWVQQEFQLYPKSSVTIRVSNLTSISALEVLVGQLQEVLPDKQIQYELNVEFVKLPVYKMTKAAA